MPSPESDFRKQKAVLWAYAGTDNYGRQTVSSPEEILVRWETTRRSSVDAQGNTTAYDVTLVIDREIAEKSVLWLGELEDLPAAPTNLHDVVEYTCVPDVKARKFRRTVRLVRRSDALPTIV